MAFFQRLFGWGQTPPPPSQSFDYGTGPAAAPPPPPGVPGQVPTSQSYDPQQPAGYSQPSYHQVPPGYQAQPGYQPPRRGIRGFFGRLFGWW